MCFFPVAINLYDGLRDTDADARKLLRSLDASRWQTLRMLELPSADFSEMLRSAMRQDEWLLLLHGAVLGFGGGMIHLALFG